MDNTSNPNERDFRAELLKKERNRAELERMVIARQGELAKFERMMQGGHEFNFPPAKNHLDHWEMDVVTRANKGRPDFDKLNSPSFSMYEATVLMRYVQEVQKDSAEDA